MKLHRPWHIIFIIRARICVLPWDFLKKANHCDNFDCYTLGNAKPVVGTSEIVAEPDYEVIKMAAISNFNIICFAS